MFLPRQFPYLKFPLFGVISFFHPHKRIRPKIAADKCMTIEDYLRE
jgi:hypothetical protein